MECHCEDGETGKVLVGRCIHGFVVMTYRMHRAHRGHELIMISGHDQLPTVLQCGRGCFGSVSAFVFMATTFMLQGFFPLQEALTCDHHLVSSVKATSANAAVEKKTPRARRYANREYGTLLNFWTSAAVRMVLWNQVRSSSLSWCRTPPSTLTPRPQPQTPLTWPDRVTGDHVMWGTLGLYAG